MSILIKIILLAADSYPPILYENSISVHITDHILGVSEQLALIHSKCFVDVVLFAADFDPAGFLNTIYIIKFLSIFSNPAGFSIGGVWFGGCFIAGYGSPPWCNDLCG